jgi:hypothetical protein
MNGHRIAVFKKQRQRGAELSPRDLQFCRASLPIPRGSMAHHLLQSSSASRLTAGAAGFLLLTSAASVSRHRHSFAKDQQQQPQALANADHAKATRYQTRPSSRSI